MIRNLFFLLLAFLLIGCVPAEDSSRTDKDMAVKRSAGYGPRLSVFQQLKKADAPSVQMKIVSVEALIDDMWVPLTGNVITVESKKIGSGQKFIATQTVPAGSCKSLRIGVTKAGIRRGGEIVPLDIHENQIVLPLVRPIRLRREDSISLFIVWDVEASLRGPTMVAPVMHVTVQENPVLADLAYVACPDINTVYMIRTDKNIVTGSIGVDGRPTYMAVNNDTGRLYVLTTADAAIKVIEIATSRVVDTITIPLTVDPNFMTLNADGSSAYVLEEYGNNLIRIDLNANSLGSRVSLGEWPQYVLYMEDRQRLAVSSTRSNTVLLLESQNLTTLESISVGSMPQGLAEWQGILYIAEQGTDSVMVYDLDNRRIRSHVAVGRQPKRILLADDRLYISSIAENSLSVLLPGQFSVSREIALAGSPLEMAATDNRRWLYVGIAGAQILQVIDFTSNRVVGSIDLGADPAGIVVVQ